MPGGRPGGRPRSPLAVRKIYTVTMEPRVDRALRAFGAGVLAAGITRAAELACAQAAEGEALRVAWRRAKRARHGTVGRPRLGRQARVKRNVVLLESVRARLREIAGGNLSQGIEMAAVCAGLIRGDEAEHGT